MKGIYKILNTANNKFYIGSSGKIRRRWNEHKRMLRLGRHHSALLQNAYNKYGKESFSFSILERMSDDATYEQLCEREQYYLDTLKPFKGTGYNLIREAGGGRMGYEHTDETKRKISEALTGKTFTDEHRRRLSEAHKTRPPVSEETRKKMSEAHRGKEPWNKGVAHTEEHRRKISEANKGMTSPMKGKKHTEETKRMMSESRSGENNVRAVVTWEIVREMRRMYAEGVMSQRNIAKHFKVSRGCVRSILKNKTWREE